MRYAVVKDGFVVNTILLTNPEDYQTDDLLIQSDSASIKDIWDGANFTRPPAPKPDPNWIEAKIGFLSDPGYQRVTLQTTAVLAVTRLETAVVDYTGGMQPTYSLFKAFWDAIVGGLSSPPTSQEIDNWNVITLQAHMKFSFAADGTMILLED